MDIDEVNDQYAQAEMEEHLFFRCVELVELAQASHWDKKDIEDLKVFLSVEDYFRSQS